MIATSLTSRRHHTDLQPLTTHTDPLVGPNRRRSAHGRGSPLSKPTGPLPSPSITAAHAYYLELASPIGPEENAIKQRRTLIQGQQVPRRHSVIPTTGNLISQLEKLAFPPAGKDLQPVPEGDQTEPKIKIEDEDMPMGVGWDKCPGATIPFQYTHNHLKNWGYAYLGNSETADAFVNAVSLRRPSLALVKEDTQVESADLVTIRARVVPKAKERKPFLIQRRFNIEEIRSRIPKSSVSIDQESKTPIRLRRSSRNRRSSACQAASTANKRPETCKTPIAGTLSLGNKALPIHIEYALHYLPVLAALMLSGHVRKYDSIDLPLPHSEAWRETVTYVYTNIGHGSTSAAVRENIKYLGGHTD